MMEAALIQLLSAVIGGAIAASILYFIIRLIFRTRPQYIRLIQTLVIYSVVVALGAFGLSVALGSMGGFALFLGFALFFVQALIVSHFVPTVDGDEIGFGVVVGAQLIQLVLAVGLFWALIELA